MATRLAEMLGKQCRRLILNIPPRHLKSILGSVAYPAWCLGHDPTARFICVSYAQELSEKHARDCREVMLSDWYQELLPDTCLVSLRPSLGLVLPLSHRMWPCGRVPGKRGSGAVVAQAAIRRGQRGAKLQPGNSRQTTSAPAAERRRQRPFTRLRSGHEARPILPFCGAWIAPSTRIRAPGRSMTPRLMRGT
jgi:hypothetical protein